VHGYRPELGYRVLTEQALRGKESPSNGHDAQRAATLELPATPAH